MMGRESALCHRQLAKNDRAGAFKALHDGAVVRRNEILMDEHTGGGRREIRVAQILHRDWDAMQRAAP
jgi:hypothetical protein